MVKAFDCGPESPTFKSHLLLHKVKSFSLPLLPLGDQPRAERAKEVKTKTFNFAFKPPSTGPVAIARTARAVPYLAPKVYAPEIVSRWCDLACSSTGR